jgi:hypothetical protein
MLGMDFVLAIAEDHVPSTGAADPYMHVFLDAGHGDVIAFFERTGARRIGFGACVGTVLPAHPAGGQVA